MTPIDLKEFNTKPDNIASKISNKKTKIVFTS